MSFSEIKHYIIFCTHIWVKVPRDREFPPHRWFAHKCLETGSFHFQVRSFKWGICPNIFSDLEFCLIFLNTWFVITWNQGNSTDWSRVQNDVGPSVLEIQMELYVCSCHSVTQSLEIDFHNLSPILSRSPFYNSLKGHCRWSCGLFPQPSSRLPG